MYFRTATAVNAIRETDFYKSRNQFHRKLLTDKCNFVVHSIIEQNRHNWGADSFEPVELSSEVLKNQLGRDYGKIMQLLIDCEVIEPERNSKGNKKYLTATEAALINSAKGEAVIQAHCIRYNLTQKARNSDIEKKGVLCKRTEAKLTAHRINQLKRMMANKAVYAKIIRSVTDVYFDEDIQHIRPNKKREKQDYGNILSHYSRALETAMQMNKAERIQDFVNIPGFYVSSSKTVGRVFHTLGTMPAEFRKGLTHRTKEKLVEIDLSSAQPIFMFSNWVKETLRFDADLSNSIQLHHIYNKGIERGKEEEEKGKREEKSICGAVTQKKKSIQEEQQLLKEILFNGTFYKYVAEYCKDKHLDIYELYQNNYSGHKGFKWLIFARGFYNKLIPIDKAHKMERVLMELFPNWITYIRREKKKKKYQAVAIEAQKAESALFIFGIFPYLSDEDFAIPVHDSLIVKESDAKGYTNMLATLFEMQHKHLNLSFESIHRVFKNTNLELKLAGLPCRIPGEDELRYEYGAE